MPERKFSARQALDEFKNVMREDDDDSAMIDLIANLGHLADSYEMDFERILRCATTHWREERTPVNPL